MAGVAGSSEVVEDMEVLVAGVSSSTTTLSPPFFLKFLFLLDLNSVIMLFMLFFWLYRVKLWG